MFKRRIGPDPHANGVRTPNLESCPDIWELANGDFAVIGLEQTSELRPHLPADASCGPDERIVVIPRKTLINAKSAIPLE